MLDSGTIAECMKRHKNAASVGDFVAAVTAELEYIETIIADLHKIRVGMAAHDREYRVIVDEDRKKLSALRQRCGHWASTFRSDASGNNDSCRTCDFCGQEI